MNEDKELIETLEQIKSQVKAKPENKDKSEDEIDEIILDGFLKAFDEGKLEENDLGAIVEAMGYEFTDEFYNALQEPGAQDMVPAEAGEEGAAEAGEPTEVGGKEALEATRTIEPGESKEDFKEKIDDVKEGKDVEVSEEEKEEDEDAEREQASKLWNMDLSKKK